MADSTESIMVENKPVPFKNALSKEECERIIRELEVIDPLAAPALLRLVGNYQAMNHVAELIRELEGVNPKPALRKNEFRAVVRYGPKPNISRLREMFSWVSDLYYNLFTTHSTCVTSDKTPREQTFVIAHFDRSMSSDEVIHAASSDACRVATLREALAFDAAYPKALREFRIVVLGSSATFRADRGLDGFRRVPVLREYQGGRALADSAFDNSWYPETRFLLIRK